MKKLILVLNDVFFFFQVSPRTCFLAFSALCLQTLIDVNLAVSQQPYDATDQLNKRVRLIQNIFLRQIPGGTKQMPKC